MMKKLVAALVLLFCMGMQLTGAAADTIEAVGNGMSNVKFEDSYYGFCISPGLDIAHEKDEFTVAGTTSNIRHVDDGRDVSNLVKCALLESFDTFYRSDSPTYPYTKNDDGTYRMTGKGQSTFFSTVWWIIGAYKEPNSTLTDEIRTIIEKAQTRAARETIADHHSETISGIKFTFDFKVFKTKKPTTDNKETQQDFFALRVAGPDAKPTPTPTPKPETPTPKPETPTPKPEQPTPTPTPKPEQPTPTPTPVPEYPDQPVDPDDPALKETIAKLPKTGDSANVELFAGLLAVSLLALGLLRRRTDK